MSEEDKLKTNNEKVTINDYYYYYLLKCEDALNELEKWLEDMSNRTTLHLSTITGFTMCLDKIQELKGSDK